MTWPICWRSSAAGLLAFLLGCSAPAPRRAQPTTTLTAGTPPSSLVPPRHSLRLPAIQRARLDNGLQIAVLSRDALPWVEVHLVIFSGSADDGGTPGVAALTGAFLSVGGTTHFKSLELLERIERMGVSLAVHTRRDATWLTLGVATPQLERAIKILAELARYLRFLPSEFERVRRRETARARSLSSSDTDWLASMALYAELFRGKGRPHPYARYDATAEQLKSIEQTDCEKWYGRHFTPKNALIAVAGGAALDAVKKLAASAFGEWEGEGVAHSAFFPPELPRRAKVVLVDRPGSTHSELRLATFASEQRGPHHVEASLAARVLDGKVLGGAEPRQGSAFAYAIRAALENVAQGPMPLVLGAKARTASTAVALASLLERFGSMKQRPPSKEALQLASGQLKSALLARWETIDSAAQLVSDLAVFGLPDDYYDDYLDGLARHGASEVYAATSAFFGGRPLMVVVGDARLLATPLSHFGEVHVLHPEDDFRVVRVVTEDPSISVELPRR